LKPFDSKSHDTRPFIQNKRKKNRITLDSNAKSIVKSTQSRENMDSSEKCENLSDRLLRIAGYKNISATACMIKVGKTTFSTDSADSEAD